MRAVIESAKFEKKKSKKDTMQQGRKAKKSEKLSAITGPKQTHPVCAKLQVFSGITQMS